MTPAQAAWLKFAHDALMTFGVCFGMWIGVYFVSVVKRKG